MLFLKECHKAFLLWLENNSNNNNNTNNNNESIENDLSICYEPSIIPKAVCAWLYLTLPTFPNRYWPTPFICFPNSQLNYISQIPLQLGLAMRIISSHWPLLWLKVTHTFPDWCSKTSVVVLCALSLCTAAGQMGRTQGRTLRLSSRTEPPGENPGHSIAPRSNMSPLYFVLCSPSSVSGARNKISVIKPVRPGALKYQWQKVSFPWIAEYY